MQGRWDDNQKVVVSCSSSENPKKIEEPLKMRETDLKVANPTCSEAIATAELLVETERRKIAVALVLAPYFRNIGELRRHPGC
ncbi:hypothetical protein EVAR_22092_1 [Eumeta japonica]|uniref:Uncharacterized protein n=1 Tax=Eumeta variegata TaxID=151549 RepID=A0A4C1UT43_EUMVA|nr:hypothetical protein EVAR_22092_1 [Eumeta japonica]